MDKSVTISISRYNPETDEKPAFRSYSVPLPDQESVLGALLHVYEHIDSTLMFHYGCRYRNCGKCAIKVNGRPALACETPVQDGMVLEPLDNLPVIRDLAVDRSGLLETLRKHDPLISPKVETDKVIQPPEFLQLMRCNECLACLSSCPVYRQNVGYDGPFFGVKLAGLRYDARETRDYLERLGTFVEQCIQCKQCLANCPWETRFPEIATRIRGELFGRKRFSARDWLMSRPALIGWIASLAASGANRVTRSKGGRVMLDRLLGIDRRAPFPVYRKERLPGPRNHLPEARLKAAYLAGCFDKYNEPETPKAAAALLGACGVEVEILDLGCCGEPFIGSGDLVSARKRAEAVSQALTAWIRKGYDIIIGCTSCGSTIRDDYPALFTLLADGGQQAHIFNLGEYLSLKQQAGQVRLSFNEFRRRIGYQVPCHLKAQQIGTPFLDLLEQVPGLDVRLIDKCCGMAGTRGFKKEKFDLCRDIGRPLMDEIRAADLDLVVSDCAACRMQIAGDTRLPTMHPIVFLRTCAGLQRDNVLRPDEVSA